MRQTLSRRNCNCVDMSSSAVASSGPSPVSSLPRAASPVFSGWQVRPTNVPVAPVRMRRVTDTPRALVCHTIWRSVMPVARKEHAT